MRSTYEHHFAVVNLAAALFSEIRGAACRTASARSNPVKSGLALASRVCRPCRAVLGALLGVRVAFGITVTYLVVDDVQPWFSLIQTLLQSVRLTSQSPDRLTAANTPIPEAFSVDAEER